LCKPVVIISYFGVLLHHYCRLSPAPRWARVGMVFGIMTDPL